MSSWSRGLAALGSLALGVLAGCGGGDTNGPNCDAIAAALVSRIEVQPATATLTLGDSIQMEAVVFSCAGRLGDVGALQWHSGDPAIATVSEGGLVRAVESGTVTIHATAQGKDGSASVIAQSAPVPPPVPAKLAFVQQPSPAQVGLAITPAVTVEIQDAAGKRVTTAASAVSVALTTPGTATLGGTLTVNAVNGLATLSDLTVSALGSYSLRATSTGLLSATSTSFVVAEPPATRLAFTHQPTSAIAGGSLGTVVVELQDASGARLTGQSAHITLAIGANPTGATLSGTLTQTTANGVATFTGLSIDRSGTGYTLAASATGLTGAVSDAFDITAGAASQLTFTVQPCPSACLVGSALVPAPRVAVQDPFGNTVTGSTATITVQLLSPQGMPSLGGTTSVRAVAGVATFATLTVNSASTGLTLRAASGPLAPDTSGAFTVATAGPQLSFSTQPPTSTAAGSTLPAVRVQLQDPQGASLPTSGVSVTVALGPSGTLDGIKTRVTDANGVATFNDLSVAASVGTGYTLTATATGYLQAVSSTFAVTAGAASQLTFTQQPPASVTSGAPISPAVSVQLRDAGGNAVSRSGTTVTLAISDGGTLTNASAATNASGLAIFTGLTATATAGAGYRITAQSNGLTSATSNSFAVVAAPVATQLRFLTQPGDKTKAGSPISPAVQVEVRDATGKRVTTATFTVTLTLGVNPTGAKLTGNVATTSNGVAQFPDLRVSILGTGYTLVATAPGLASATSSTFRIR